MNKHALVLALVLPLTAATGRPPVREPLHWLAGCWQMQRGAAVIEEQWLRPRAGVLLGTGRTVRDGELAEYEFVVLRTTAAGATYEAHPSGQAVATFTATRVPDSTAIVFENPEHDFPQRVGYRLVSRDSLTAWIEGTVGDKSRRIEFPYARAACEGD